METKSLRIDWENHRCNAKPAATLNLRILWGSGVKHSG
jgi:hypothetical protein